MGNKRVSMERDAVESMQDNLDRAEPAIAASYTLIGAILLLGAAGFVADRYLGTAPWCVLAGLIAGMGIGFERLALLIRRRQ
jgi:F0F1-type ATP synthase assembly protein I